MSEPKKSEVAKTRVPAGKLELVSEAKVSELVYKSAEDTLVVCGTVIHSTDSGMFSLNDLHKAVGSPSSKRPGEFLRSAAAQETIATLKESGIENYYETIIGGANSGTFAHKLLAYEYATVLDKRFKVRALIVLDEVTNAQVRKVEELKNLAVAQYGEAEAARLATVAELQAATKDAKDSRLIISALEHQAGAFRSLKQKPKLVMDYIGLQKVCTAEVTFALENANTEMLGSYEDIDSVIHTLKVRLSEDMTKYWRDFVTNELLRPLESIAANLKVKLGETTEDLRKAKNFRNGVDRFLADQAH